MLIKEYRIPLPLTVEEYRIAQLYMIAKKSRQESTGADSGSGVEILVNEPYKEGPGGAGGQFTHKVYHVGSHLPGWFKSLLPKSALTVEEKAWNAYPYTKTVFSCPFVEKFSLEIETYYTPDGGHLENVFDLKKSELGNRQVDLIDVVRDQEQNPSAEEDPTKFVSNKTGRGPLDQDWLQTYSDACRGQQMPTTEGKAIMCAYKLCKVEFRYWGMQSKIERFIHDMALRHTMLQAHRQAWVWQDEWHGLTMSDIRDIERQTAEELKCKMRGEEAVKDEGAEIVETSDGDISKSFNSIEYTAQEVPNIIPKGSNMLTRRSICVDDGINGIPSDQQREDSKNSDKVLAVPIETIGRGKNYDSDEDLDEFYDCHEIPDDIKSLTKWNSMELVPDTPDPDAHDGGQTAPMNSRHHSTFEEEFRHHELRRTVSHRMETNHTVGGKYIGHPTIELGVEMREELGEPACSTTILILVAHGGSVLDAVTDLAVRKSDVTTFRGAFESVMRQHYPSMVGHIVIKCVPCPSICEDSLTILSNLDPYSFDVSSGVNSDRLPIGTIPLLATASTKYPDSVNQMITTANKVFQEFLASEEGTGFSGQVSLIGDSIGSILAYDALCKSMKRSGSDVSVGDIPENHCDSPHSGKLDQHAFHPRQSIQSLATGPSQMGEDNSHSLTFQFDVSDFFVFGSPIGLLLAYRRQMMGDLKGLPKKPNCGQIYNLFHPSNPITTRLEPLLSSSFTCLPPVNVPRYQKFPTGDGQILSLIDLIQANPYIFNENNQTSGCNRVRRPSSESIISGVFDTQQMHALTKMKSHWWGTKRIDFALYCPEGLANFPTNSLPHLFHASFWESTDVISFILRQLIQHDLGIPLTADIEREANLHFVPNQAREKWMKKRTSVKTRNRAANHRANDIIVLEGKEQVLHGRFSYGPLDMAALTNEHVDIHIMKEPPSGEWTFLSTQPTDKNGRLTYKIPVKDSIGYGVFPVRMVVRGDHTVLDLHLAVVPPQTETVIFSIDGSFTASVSVSGKDPKVRPSSVDVVRHWQDLGYLIIYVTGRPCMQLQKVVSWLSMHNFPHGLVSFADGFSTDPLRHKTDFLRSLQQDNQVILHAGYGSSKDISVYSSLGIKPTSVNIVGKVSRKQQPLCNHLCDGYAAHLSQLQTPGGSRPAKGNARMVIPKTYFGLPGQFAVATRRTYRANSKKYSSLPVSAPPLPRSESVRMSVK